MGEGRDVYRVFVGKPEGKRQLEKPRRRLDDNIKMDLQEVGCGGMDWIGLGPDIGRLAGTCECGDERLRSIKSGEFRH
jgi:hypothetical protein